MTHMSYTEYNAKSVGLPSKLQPITTRAPRNEFNAHAQLRLAQLLAMAGVK